VDWKFRGGVMAVDRGRGTKKILEQSALYGLLSTNSFSACCSSENCSLHNLLCMHGVRRFGKVGATRRDQKVITQKADGRVERC
jgi:hypothetical protein